MQATSTITMMMYGWGGGGRFIFDVIFGDILKRLQGRYDGGDYDDNDDVDGPIANERKDG